MGSRRSLNPGLLDNLSSNVTCIAFAAFITSFIYVLLYLHYILILNCCISPSFAVFSPKFCLRITCILPCGYMHGFTLDKAILLVLSSKSESWGNNEYDLDSVQALTLLHEEGHQWVILGWFPKTVILVVAFELSNFLLFLQLVRHLKLQNPPECAALPRLALFVYRA